MTTFLGIPEDYLWIVVLGFIIAFVLAFGIGANDVANSFGTSVGSKVLTLRQACILATIFETAGAVLLGAKVSETIRKGIIDTDYYVQLNNNGTSTTGSELLMMGQLSSLSGTCIWLLVATFFRVPVSGTHSIVGATVGFALVANAQTGVDWGRLGLIVASWFISPLLSGAISIALFYFIKIFILTKPDPLEPGLRFLPLIYSVTIAINVFSIVYEGPESLYFHLIPLWGAILTTFGVGIVCSVLIKLILIPWQRRRILAELHDNPKEELGASDVDAASFDAVSSAAAASGASESTNKRKGKYKPIGSGEDEEPAVQSEHQQLQRDGDTGADDVSKKEKKAIVDRPEQARIFAWLQILTAIFGAFAHGGNDVSNAIGPLIGLWVVATTGDIAGKAASPIGILIYGGVGISVGLWIWGRRVIQTLGEDLTTITPSSGFCIELGAALAVLIASNIGIPISTTHCKVGSVVLVGFFRSRDNVQWSIFRNIIIAWLVTLPASGAISAALMAGLSRLVL